VEQPTSGGEAVAAVAVRLRPDPEADSSGNVWDQLSEKWHGALDPDSLDDVFGTAEVFTGVADEPAADLLVAAGDAAHKVLAAHGDSGLELSITAVARAIINYTRKVGEDVNA
jgi:hypothetical protein